MNARDLSNRLVDLLKKERHALSEFLVALAEFDRDRQWAALGHSTLFNYLRRDLGLSKGAAFYRMTAAHLIQRHPEVIEPLRDGRLCFTSIVELSKVATPENFDEVLPRFFDVSKSEAKEVAAELNPVPAPVRTVITGQRTAAPHPALGLSGAAPSPSSPLPPPSVDSGQKVHPDEPASAATPLAHPMTVEPKTADQGRLHLTVSRAFLRKLDAARDALSHSHPGASADAILEAGLDLVLERSAKRKGLVRKPRKEPPARQPTSAWERDDYIPAHVRREVWKRDQGRCQFPLEGGGVCGSTYRVQLDHIIPVAKGGPSDPGNLRCACQPHNLDAARQELGDAVVDRYTRGRRPTPQA